MNTKRFIYFLSLLLGVIFSIAPAGRAQVKPETKGPVIPHAFAVEKGHYGFIWKIYLEAEDPDEQMFKIACSVYQPGYGHYPTDWIYLKREYQKHFRGYLQWNTFSSKTPYLVDGTQIVLGVSIIDKAGNESREVVFPFTFGPGVKGQYQYKLPSPFNEGDVPKLGNITTELFEPTGMGIK